MKLIEEGKCVIQHEINLGKVNVSFSQKLFEEMKCVIQGGINWGNGMCHSVRN